MVFSFTSGGLCWNCLWWNYRLRPSSLLVKAKTEPTKTQTDSEPAIPPVKASEATNAPEELKKEPKAGSSQPKAAAKKAPEKGKEKKLTKDEMEVKVLEYMRQQNRPYNAQNVFDNLHGAVPKGSVQTIMESLVTEGKLLIKEYGKIKVFLVSQSLVVGGDDATALQQEVDEASKKRKALGNDLDTTRKEMSQVASKHAAAKEAKESAAEALTLEARAKQLKGSGEEQVEESEVRAVEAAFTQVHQTWRKRKRLCMDTLRTLGEAMSTRTDQLLEQYGVDTDEDCGQTLPLEFSQ
ncbi:unnamed protein product [Durusdinium trenchii]|uniref:Homologous-pairing protein 2 winged helix domain-containing protein n=1 Tax=Durusdinium trenchii TaxID=1381693 RepID=A0ABP0NL75_9DINO